MMRFRAMFGLAALVVLAACKDQSDGWNYVESEPIVISGGEGQPEITVTRSCGPRALGGYERFDRGAFRIMSESSDQALTWLSDDKREVVAISFSIDSSAQCFANIRTDTEVAVSPIPRNQWEFLPEEAAAYGRVYRRCEAIGSVVNRIYPRVIINSVSYRGGAPVVVANTDAGLLFSDSIDGCSHMVPAYTQGIIVKTKTASWRVFIVLDQIVINRIL